jgi:hypothetical protein
MTDAMEIDADVRVHPNSRITLGESAWAPNVLIGNSYYPGRILACARPIAPGGRGRVKVGILTDRDHRPSLEVGTHFELRDGPSIGVADAVVLAVTGFADGA